MIRLALALIVLLVSILSASAAPRGGIVTPVGGTSTTVGSFSLQNTGGGTLASHQITFGQAFSSGAVPSGSAISVMIGGTRYDAQLDVKTTWGDSSAKHGIVTFKHPAIAGSTTVAATIITGGTAPGSPLLLSSLVGDPNYALTVVVAVSGGSTYTMDVNALLNTAIGGAAISYWQQGTQATQGRFDHYLTSSMRMTFDVTIFADGTNRTDVQFNNDYTMTGSGGLLTYNETSTLNSVTVGSWTAVPHYQYQTRHETFWSAAAPTVNIIHDVQKFIDLKFIHNFNLNCTLCALSTWISAAANLIATGSPAIICDSNSTLCWGGPLPVNNLRQDMTGTGNRVDIGPVTHASALWLMTQNATAAAYAIGQADAAGSVPWHFYDVANGHYLSVLDYPTIWADSRGGSGPPGGITQDVASNVLVGWASSPDHSPSAAYAPYLLTGVRYYLDKLNAQAAWTIVRTVPSSSYGRGVGATNDILINLNDQTRQQAWSMRDVQYAYLANPDGSYEKTYFLGVLNHNWAYLASQIAALTTQQGDATGWLPEYSASSPTNTEMSPWVESYFASTLGFAVLNSFTNASTCLTWAYNYMIGRYATHSGWDIQNASSYRNIVTNGSGTYYSTWGAINTASVAFGGQNSQNPPNYWSDANYEELAMMAAAVIYRALGSDTAALAAYNFLYTSNAPLLHSDPQFQIIP